MGDLTLLFLLLQASQGLLEFALNLVWNICAGFFRQSDNFCLPLLLTWPCFPSQAPASLPLFKQQILRERRISFALTLEMAVVLFLPLLRIWVECRNSGPAILTVTSCSACHGASFPRLAVLFNPGCQGGAASSRKALQLPKGCSSDLLAWHCGVCPLSPLCMPYYLN